MSLYTSKELFTLQLQETTISPQETNQGPEKFDFYFYMQICLCVHGSYLRLKEHL